MHRPPPDRENGSELENAKKRGRWSSNCCATMKFILTNYRGMAISCIRTAAHTTSWVARASRCPVEPWENKNRSNGGKLHGNQEKGREEKETLTRIARPEIPQSLSR